MTFIRRLMEIKEEQLAYERQNHIIMIDTYNRINDIRLLILKVLKDYNGNKTRSKRKNT